MIPSLCERDDLFLPPPIRGMSDSNGSSATLRIEDRSRVCMRSGNPAPLLGFGDPASEAEVVLICGVCSPKDGNTLSFADKLKNRKNGTSQTHTPKKVATSIKDSSLRLECPLPLFPYLASQLLFPGL